MSEHWPKDPARVAPFASDEEAAVLRAVLDTAVEGIVVIDAVGTVQSINPAALEMFGYEADEVVGRNVKCLMPSNYSQEHDGYLSRYIDTGEAKIIGTGREVEGLRKDGTVFPLGLAVSDVNFAGRRLFAGILRDLTERRDAESKARARLHELAHASRLLELGEMTSGLGHEINQPLTAIVTFAQACRRMVTAGSATPELLEDTLGQIVQQGERAAEIVKSLRSFSRKHSDEREVVFLTPLIEGVVNLLRHELRRSGVQLRLHGLDEASAVSIEVSRIQIEQVLVNLIRNAIDAMDTVPRGRRRLDLALAETEDGMVRMTVSDSGDGIAEENLGRLFDAYFTTKSDGMGVGLAISKTIAEAHGGELTATNSAHRGAQFVLTVPGYSGDVA